MSDFYCGNCDYITSSKSSMERHKARKTPCQPKIVAVPPPIVIHQCDPAITQISSQLKVSLPYHQ